jgi:hypothetical protein
MRIRFKTSIADATCNFVEGRTVSFPQLPLGWEKWLEAGIIEILPEPVERAIVTPTHETAVAPIARGRARRRAIA